jgi:hypothetical protein
MECARLPPRPTRRHTGGEKLAASCTRVASKPNTHTNEVGRWRSIFLEISVRARAVPRTTQLFSRHYDHLTHARRVFASSFSTGPPRDHGTLSCHWTAFATKPIGQRVPVQTRGILHLTGRLTVVPDGGSEPWSLSPRYRDRDCISHDVKEEEEDLFVFNDTTEGPRASAVKTGRFTPA